MRGTYKSECDFLETLLRCAQVAAYGLKFTLKLIDSGIKLLRLI